MNIEEEKSKIRKEIKRRRMSLSAEVLAKIEKELPEFIASIDDEELSKKLKSAKRIALYRSFKGEVPVDGLAKSFMEKGITCCFPRVEDEDMVFCDCKGLGKDEFEESPLGIREPLRSKKHQNRNHLIPSDQWYPRPCLYIKMLTWRDISMKINTFSYLLCC